MIFIVDIVNIACRKAFAWNWVINGMIIGLIVIVVFASILSKVYVEEARQSANKQFNEIYSRVNALCSANPGEEMLYNINIPDIVELMYISNDKKALPDDADIKKKGYDTATASNLCIKFREEPLKCRVLKCKTEMSYIGEKKTVMSLADSILSKPKYVEYPIFFKKESCGVTVLKDGKCSPNGCNAGLNCPVDPPYIPSVTPQTPSNAQQPPVVTPEPIVCTKFVAKNGDDNNPGTEASPWLTIQKAADVAVAGDTVCVKAGIYNERVVFGNDGTSASPITFKNYGTDTVVIDGSGKNVLGKNSWEVWQGLVDIRKNYITVMGFQIKNSDWFGIFVLDANNIVIKNNYIYNAYGSGINVEYVNHIIIDGNELDYVTSCFGCNPDSGVVTQEALSIALNVDDFVVSNNKIHDTGHPALGAEGIDAKYGASNGKIFGNIVWNTNSVGIYVDAWDTYARDIDVYNNIVHDPGSSGIAISGEEGGRVSRVRVYNNIVYNAKIAGILIPAYANPNAPVPIIEDVTIENNVVYNSEGGLEVGLMWIAIVNNLIIRNNIFANNWNFQMARNTNYNIPIIDRNLIYSFKNYNDGDMIEVRGDNYVELDPEFLNPTGYDFHLQPSSPAIDAGTSTGVSAADFDGNARPKGAGYDIGAYEYGSTNVPPNTPQPVACTKFVAKNGDDNNPGTEALPWLTIQKAADVAVAGDTVCVKDGIYNERVSPQNDGVSYISQNPRGAVIDGSGVMVPENWNGLVDIYNKNDILISGFEIRNANTDAVRFGVLIRSGDNIIIKDNYFHGIRLSAIDSFWERGVPFNPTTNLVIDGNEITDVQREGTGQEIITLANVNGFDIKNNRIYGNHMHESIAVMKGSRNGAIHHNDIEPITSAGIYIYGWFDTDPIMENIDVYNNKVHGGGYGVRGIAIASESGGAIRHIKIYNNIVYNTGAPGIIIDSYDGRDCWPFDGTNPCHSGPEDDIQIIGNTVYHNDFISGWGGGIRDNSPTTSNVVIRNNIAWDNNADQINVKSGDIEDHNLITDPLFVNANGGDFHLQSTSPAIDAGTSTGAPNVDFDGNARPKGAGYDIGAYESG